MLCTEHLGGPMGEAPSGVDAGHSILTPMAFRQTQGQGHAVYTHRGACAGCGGLGGAGGGAE